jgi:4-hydroxy-3-methylbut-2-en-1-yl diphosphate synthase IspG/GcpE
MTDKTRKILGNLKARQDSGEHMLCPRCGRDTMKESIHTNALSQHADICR